MNEELQNTAAEQSATSAQASMRRYKFMTNILVRAQDKETYVKLLKKVTKDALVPTNRIIFSGAIVLATLVFTLWLTFSDIDRLLYVALPCILLVIGSIWISYYLMISSRKKSMLSSVMTLLLMKVSEKIRLGSTKYGELQTLGIKSFKKGYLLFEDGDYGVCYAFAGQLGKSTLPEVANQVHQIRFDYLVSRSDTSHETTFTSIKQLNVDKQVEYYKMIYDINSGDSIVNMWNRYMSKMIKEEVENKIAKNEVSIYQYLILREPNAKDLTKSMQLLDLAASDGMYASLRKVETAKELIDSIGAVSLISRKGSMSYVEKEERQKEKFERQ
jgi:hypothetical protein